MFLNSVVFCGGAYVETFNTVWVKDKLLSKSFRARTFVPGAKIWVQVKSKFLNRHAQEDSFGFCSKEQSWFRLILYCSARWSHRLVGEVGFRVSRVEMELFSMFWWLFQKNCAGVCVGELVVS